MAKILFCGSLLPKAVSEKIKYCSPAANNFQHDLICGLSRRNDVQILSYIGYPIQDEGEYFRNENSNDIAYVCKHMYHGLIALFSTYYRKFRDMMHGKDYIILYNYNYMHLLINSICHREKIKTAIILADHSEASEYRNPIRKMLSWKYERDYRKFDSVIVLSREMKEKLQVKNVLLFEGGIHSSTYQDFRPASPSGQMLVYYAGLLSRITGVDILLDAIAEIKETNVCFLFSGKGELQDDVINCSRRDPRVRYIGFVSESEYLRQLSDAHIVVNPRNMDLPQNRNNFPSKIMGYLAAGKTIVSTRFPGYEQFEECISFCDHTPEGITFAIMTALKEYQKEYMSKFMLNRKKAAQYDWVTQVEKIEEFLQI